MEKAVFNMVYSIQSIPRECRTSLSGTNCNCLLGLIEFYTFHHVFYCCINACVIREIMVDGLKLSLSHLVLEILPCKPFLPHFDCNFQVFAWNSLSAFSFLEWLWSVWARHLGPPNSVREISSCSAQSMLSSGECLQRWSKDISSSREVCSASQCRPFCKGVVLTPAETGNTTKLSVSKAFWELNCYVRWKDIHYLINTVLGRIRFFLKKINGLQRQEVSIANLEGANNMTRKVKVTFCICDWAINKSINNSSNK